MRKDYHIHPNALRAPERFDQFVASALQKNIGEICITDHMPLSYSNAPDRIPHGKVREYCAFVREMAKRYEDRIRILCGIEVDFHPSARSEVDRVLDEGDFDIVLGSSHMHIFLKDFENYTFNDFARLSLENSLCAVEYGRCSILAHLDMYRWAFRRRERFPLRDDGYTPQLHEDLLKELLSAVAKKGMCLEINAHMISGKNDLDAAYPEKTILSWAMEQGVRFSYGSDAHSPDAVGAYLRELEAHPSYAQALSSWETK